MHTCTLAYLDNKTDERVSKRRQNNKHSRFSLHQYASTIAMLSSPSAGKVPADVVGIAGAGRGLGFVGECHSQYLAMLSSPSAGMVPADVVGWHGACRCGHGVRSDLGSSHGQHSPAPAARQRCHAFVSSVVLPTSFQHGEQLEAVPTRSGGAA